MNKYKKNLIPFSVLFLIVACASSPENATIDQLVAEGGELVEPVDLIADTGVTFVGADGGWFNYLGADGRKVVKINKTGVVKELTWRVDDTGKFCQQMFATEEEVCDSHVLIKGKDGIYNSYKKENNKPGFPFTIESGNPQGF